MILSTKVVVYADFYYYLPRYVCSVEGGRGL